MKRVNESSHYGWEEDFSEAAHERFQQWLKAKYKNIETLNKEWGTAFWSQVYNTFDQVAIPNEARSSIDFINPHAMLDWKRFNAPKWNVDKNKIGIMGFSAGGHLASTLGTHFDYGNISSADSVERQSCRPDFMILMYPVVSFTDTVKHSGSRKNLLGENPDKDLVILYSNELQVKDDTPPAFFVHADNDEGVPVENTLLMYKALRKKKIPAELHILSEGGHGFGLAVNNEHVASWTNSMRLWLNSLKKSE